MSQPFVLHIPSGPRWVLHPAHDSYGDGYLLTAATELHADGMTASTIAHIDGSFEEPQVMRLSAFVGMLAADWRGWHDVRTWRSYERQLALDARHDGRGHVSLGVTLRQSGLHFDDTAWSVRAVFDIEAGEEMSRLAADLSHFLAT